MSLELEEAHVKFDHAQGRFRCCCGSVHVKHGMIIIAILYSFIVFIDVWFMLSMVQTSTDLIIQCVILPFHIGSVLCAVYGVKKERPFFLLPFFIDQIVKFLILSSFFVLFIWGIYDVESPASKFLRNNTISAEELEYEILVHKQPQMTFLLRMTAVFMAMLAFLFMILCVWFSHVAYRCFVYLREVHTVRIMNDGRVHFGGKHLDSLDDMPPVPALNLVPDRPSIKSSSSSSERDDYPKTI